MLLTQGTSGLRHLARGVGFELAQFFFEAR